MKKMNKNSLSILTFRITLILYSSYSLFEANTILASNSMESIEYIKQHQTKQDITNELKLNQIDETSPSSSASLSLSNKTDKTFDSKNIISINIVAQLSRKSRSKSNGSIEADRIDMKSTKLTNILLRQSISEHNKTLEPNNHDRDINNVSSQNSVVDHLLSQNNLSRPDTKIIQNETELKQGYLPKLSLSPKETEVGYR